MSSTFRPDAWCGHSKGGEARMREMAKNAPVAKPWCSWWRMKKRGMMALLKSQP